MSDKKIGIFGGTFDPLHRGHLKIARLVQKKFQLDKIIFIPSGRPPHKKKPQASKTDRLKMVQLALAGQKDFLVSDYEIKKTGRSYSVKTLNYFKNKFRKSRIFFIIGLDSLLEIKTWRQPEKILSLAELIVVFRPNIGVGLTGPTDWLGRLGPNFKKFQKRIHFVKIKGMAISSTEIRRKIKKGQSGQKLLPGPVAKFILRNKLYGN